LRKGGMNLRDESQERDAERTKHLEFPLGARALVTRCANAPAFAG
jgi:hypothetical protein